jgi:hypothetical protein
MLCSAPAVARSNGSLEAFMSAVRLGKPLPVASMLVRQPAPYQLNYIPFTFNAFLAKISLCDLEKLERREILSSKEVNYAQWVCSYGLEGGKRKYLKDGAGMEFEIVGRKISVIEFLPAISFVGT